PDIRLTMQTYTHAGLYDLAAAVESLPPIMPTNREGQRLVLAATGTNGAPGPCLDQNGETASDCVRTPEAGNGRNEAGVSVRKTLQIKSFAIDCDGIESIDSREAIESFWTGCLGAPARISSWPRDFQPSLLAEKSSHENATCGCRVCLSPDRSAVWPVPSTWRIRLGQHIC